MKLAQAGIGLILSATLATGAEDDSSCTGEPYSISFYSEKTRGLATVHRFRYEGKIQSRKQKSIYCKPDPAVMEFAGPMNQVKLTDLDDDGKIDIVNIYFADGTRE